MKLFCAALTAAPVTGDNSIVPIAIIAMAVVVVIAPIVLPSLYSNSHDRSNCEHQRLDCHRGFHGDSPYSSRLSVVLN